MLNRITFQVARNGKGLFMGMTEGINTKLIELPGEFRLSAALDHVPEVQRDALKEQLGPIIAAQRSLRPKAPSLGYKFMNGVRIEL